MSAEPSVGHKGVGVDNSKIDLVELSPRFKNLTATFKTMLSEETSKLLSYIEERGTLHGKNFDEIKGAQSELLALLQEAQSSAAKAPEVAKVDFATSPVLVARMETSTSPILFKGVDRGLSPIDLIKYADVQMATSPLAAKTDVRITLLSPPRKRALTPESVVGSYLSSHHSDEASEAPADAQEGLSVERVWDEDGSPLSASSNLSETASSSSRQTVFRAPPSRVSTRRRVSSPPATIPGFNGPGVEDEVSPADSVSSVGISVPQHVVEQTVEQRSMLLEPVANGGSVHGSIEMPVPLRAVPFEGSLADFMANHVPLSGHVEERTEIAEPVVEKIDQGTSPLVFESEVLVEEPAADVIESEPEPVEEVMPSTVEKAISPFVLPTETVSEPEEPVEPEEPEELEDVVSTTEKAVSPLVPPSEPAQVEEDTVSTTEKAVSPGIPTAEPEPEPEPEEIAPELMPSKVEQGTSPLIFPVTPAPQNTELLDPPAEEEVVPPADELDPEQIEEVAVEMVDEAISPMTPTPVLEESEDTAEALEEEEETSPASTVKPLPAKVKVDVACETEPPVEEAPAPAAEAEVEVPLEEAPEPVVESEAEVEQNDVSPILENGVSVS